MLPPALQKNFMLDAASQERYGGMFHRMEVPAREVLLEEGQVSKKAYLVVEGCLRVWFNNHGREVTCQFFFEGEGVSSIESFRNNTPSVFTIETIEPSVVYWIHKSDFQTIQDEQYNNATYLHHMMHVVRAATALHATLL